MDNGFKFGPRATWEFPILRVERYPEIPTPVKRYETYTVPGRSGELHSFEGAYEQIKKKYDCYFHADEFVAETAAAVKAWLLGTDGYQRLTDSYDRIHYFRAAVLDTFPIENWRGKYGRFTVSFSCDPRAFLVAGDDPLHLTSPTTVCNPTANAAQPLIRVFGSGAGTVVVGGVTVQVKALDGELVLDCEAMDAYRVADGAAVNLNSTISAPEFPVLGPGETAVSWTGGVTRLEITPRWFDL